MDNKNSIVQFCPQESFVSPTFWHKLAETKLDLDGLSDKPKPIYGFYSNRLAKSCLLEVDYTAFNRYVCMYVCLTWCLFICVVAGHGANREIFDFIFEGLVLSAYGLTYICGKANK